MPPAKLLIDEVKALEWDAKGKKIVKPPRGTKDLADAMIGVVYYISENMRSDLAMMPSLGLSTVAATMKGGHQWSDGDVNWNDGDEPAQRRPRSGDGENFSQWIVQG